MESKSYYVYDNKYVIGDVINYHCDLCYAVTPQKVVTPFFTDAYNFECLTCGSFNEEIVRDENGKQSKFQIIETIDGGKK